MLSPPRKQEYTPIDEGGVKPRVEEEVHQFGSTLFRVWVLSMMAIAGVFLYTSGAYVSNENGKLRVVMKGGKISSGGVVVGAPDVINLKKDEEEEDTSSSDAAATSESYIDCGTLKDVTTVDGIPTTTNVYAPLFMQTTSEAGGETSYIKLLFQKYGWTDNRPALTKAPTMAADSGGWAYATVSQGSECDGTEYFTAGVKLAQCIPLTSSSSFIMECSDSTGLSYYEYDSSDCSGSVESSKIIASVGCSASLNETQYFDFDDDSYPSSINIACTSNQKAPYLTSTTKYDVWKAFDDSKDDDAETTCQSELFDYYEAYALDTCIPINVWTHCSSDESCVFKVSDADDDDADDSSSSTPYLKMYTEQRNCGGSHTKYDLSTECVDCGHLYWSTKWSYWSGFSEEKTLEATTSAA